MSGIVTNELKAECDLEGGKSTSWGQSKLAHHSKIPGLSFSLLSYSLY